MYNSQNPTVKNASPKSVLSDQPKILWFIDWTNAAKIKKISLIRSVIGSKAAANGLPRLVKTGQFSIHTIQDMRQFEQQCCRQVISPAGFTGLPGCDKSKKSPISVTCNGVIDVFATDRSNANEILISQKSRSETNPMLFAFFQISFHNLFLFFPQHIKQMTHRQL